MTQGPADQGAAASRGHLRASHADREHVIDTLKAAFVQGRLTKDELDLRAGHALTARTYADLAALTADIPAGLTAARPPREPARARTRRPVNKAVKWGAYGFITPAMLVATVAIVLLTDSGDIAQMLIGATVIYFWAWLVAGAQMLHTWHENRSRGQLPSRPARRRQLLEGEWYDGTGDGLIRCEARPDARARHLPGHRVIQRTWRSLTVRRPQRPPAGLQSTA